MKLPRELVAALEWALREYPSASGELSALDRYLEELCHASPPAGEPGGRGRNGPPSSVEERILEVKERNVRRMWLAGFVRRVEGALAALKNKEMKFVNCYYWEERTIEYISLEFRLDVRSVYYMRDRVLSRIGPFIMPDFVFCHQPERYGESLSVD